MTREPAVIRVGQRWLSNGPSPATLRIVTPMRFGPAAMWMVDSSDRGTLTMAANEIIAHYRPT